MRVGLRLCLSCGKQAVQFHRAAPGDLDAHTIVLERAKDDAAFVAGLHEFFATVAAAVPRLNFIVGDVRMYSKSELAQRHKLPAVLIADLDPDTGKALATRLKTGGYKIRSTTVRGAQRARRVTRGLLAGSGATVVAGSVAIAIGGGAAALGGLGIFAAIVTGMIGVIRWGRGRAMAKRVPLAQLRAAPAALPAGDALVATVAAALTASKSPDVRARLEEIALLVQRLADARAALVRAGPAAVADAERITAPVRPLADLACTTAAAIEAIDHQLTTLDEGAIMRALARCDARGEAPELRHDLLAGLDTLRQLEDERARLFGRLLEISSLLRAAVTLGLQQTSQLHSDDAEVAHAFAALDD
jgi:hypothetical protein